MADPVFASVSDFAASYKQTNPQFSSWNDDVLYGTLYRQDAGVSSLIKDTPAPVIKTFADVATSIRSRNPELKDMDDASFSSAILAQFPELKTFVEKPASLPAGIPSESWVGRPLQSDIASLSGGVEYLDIVDKNRKSQAGFWEEVLPSDAQDIPFIGDVAAGVELAKLPGIITRLKNGEDVTDQELVDLNTYLAKTDREVNRTFLGKVGAGIKDFFKFGTEMAGTTAIIGGGLLATVGSGGAAAPLEAGAVGLAAKQLATRAAVDAARTAVKSAVKGLVEKSVGKLAGKVVASGLGTTLGVVTELTATGLAYQGVNTAIDKLAATAMGEGTATTKGAVDRQIQAIYEGKDGSADKAAWLDAGDMFVEYMSEMSGAYLGKAATKIGGLFVKDMPAYEFGKWFSDAVKNRMGTAASAAIGAASKAPKAVAAAGAYVGNLARKYNVDVDTALRIAKQSGYDGYLEEMGEERFGGFIRGLFGIDGSEAGLKNAWDQMWPSIDDFAVEAVVFAMPMAMAGGLHAAQQSKLLGGPGLRTLTNTQQEVVKATTPIKEDGKEVVFEGRETDTKNFDNAVELVAQAAEAEGNKKGVLSGVIDWALAAVTFDLSGMQFSTLDRALQSEGVDSLAKSYRMVRDNALEGGASNETAQTAAKEFVRESLRNYRGAFVVDEAAKAELREKEDELLTTEIVRGRKVRRIIPDNLNTLADASRTALLKTGLDFDVMTVKQYQDLDLTPVSGSLKAVVEAAQGIENKPDLVVRTMIRAGYDPRSKTDVRRFKTDFGKLSEMVESANNVVKWVATFSPNVVSARAVRGTASELASLFTGYSEAEIAKSPVVGMKNGAKEHILAIRASVREGKEDNGKTVFNVDYSLTKMGVREALPGGVYHAAEDTLEMLRRAKMSGTSMDEVQNALANKVLEWSKSQTGDMKTAAQNLFAANTRFESVGKLMLRAKAGWNKETGNGENRLPGAKELNAIAEVPELQEAIQAVDAAYGEKFGTNWASVFGNPYASIEVVTPVVEVTAKPVSGPAVKVEQPEKDVTELGVGEYNAEGSNMRGGKPPTAETPAPVTKGPEMKGGKPPVVETPASATAALQAFLDNPAEASYTKAVVGLGKLLDAAGLTEDERKGADKQLNNWLISMQGDLTALYTGKLAAKMVPVVKEQVLRFAKQMDDALAAKRAAKKPAEGGTPAAMAVSLSVARTEDEFEQMYAKEAIKDLKETRDEFLRRKYCSGLK